MGHACVAVAAVETETQWSRTGAKTGHIPVTVVVAAVVQRITTGGESVGVVVAEGGCYAVNGLACAVAVFAGVGVGGGPSAAGGGVLYAVAVAIRMRTNVGRCQAAGSVILFTLSSSEPAHELIISVGSFIAR